MNERKLRTNNCRNKCDHEMAINAVKLIANASHSVLWILTTPNTRTRQTLIQWMKDRIIMWKCQVISDTTRTQKRRFSSWLDFWSFRFEISSEFELSSSRKKTAMKWSRKSQWQFWLCGRVRWQVHFEAGIDWACWPSSTHASNVIRCWCSLRWDKYCRCSLSTVSDFCDANHSLCSL